MRRHLHFLAPYVLLAMAVICLVLAMPGCAKQPPTVQAYRLADLYIRVHEDYDRAYESAEPRVQQYMRTHIAPRLNQAKRLIDAALTAAIAGEDIRSGGTLDEVESLLVDAALAIADLAYGGTQ